MAGAGLGDNDAVTAPNEPLPATAGSGDLFSRALDVTPGGVNSPVRAFRAVGGTPRFMARGMGPYLYDVDGNEYVDLVCSWGPLILGHAHPAVVDAVQRAVVGGYVVRHPVGAGAGARRGDRRPDAGGTGPARLLRAPRRPCPRSGWRAASPDATWS